MSIHDMKPKFKYDGNAKDSTKKLKGGYITDDFWVLDVYLNEKGSSVKIQFLNIFKDYHILV